jgi:hypothetical protein
MEIAQGCLIYSKMAVKKVDRFISFMHAIVETMRVKSKPFNENLMNRGNRLSASKLFT